MVWLFGGRCRSTARLDGRTALVTGANTGIGKETALGLAARGARVILAVRDPAKGERAAAAIRRQLAKTKRTAGGPGGQVLVEQLDLASLRSVRACARRILEREESLHILVNNAGVMVCPKARTEDGFDQQFGVNHLGHFLLTLLLLPRLRASGSASDGQPARIVTVSSAAYSISKLDFDDLQYEQDHKPLFAYSRSKLANMLFSRELARRLKEAQEGAVATYCVHPGVVATELMRHLDTFIVPGTRFLVERVGRFFIKTPEQGAQTSIHCAVDEGAAKESGLYYVDCAASTPFAVGRNDEAALRLWDVSVGLVGLNGYDPLAVADTPAWALEVSS